MMMDGKSGAVGRKMLPAEYDRLTAENEILEAENKRMSDTSAELGQVVEQLDQALAWVEKGLAKTSDKELLGIKTYVLATRKLLNKP